VEDTTEITVQTAAVADISFKNSRNYIASTHRRLTTDGQLIPTVGNMI